MIKCLRQVSVHYLTNKLDTSPLDLSSGKIQKKKIPNETPRIQEDMTVPNKLVYSLFNHENLFALEEAGHVLVSFMSFMLLINWLLKTEA